MGSPATCLHSLQVNITSRRIIRPSSPTPRYQRTLDLSLLDQLFHPTLYTTTIYFYPSASNNALQTLQTSLSRALVHFYPLAGRLNGPASIDCNDEGAYFLEAQVNCQLSEFLKFPEESLLNNLVPQFDPQTADSAVGSAVFLVQVSRFNCGGIALAVSPSHKIADATSSYKFVRAWAAIHRNDEYDHQTVVPQFNGASVLPAKDSFVNNFKLPKYQTVTTRRFVFDATKLANLKAKLGSTNVQLVSAILLRSACSASYQSSPDTSSSIAVFFQMVSLRRSMGSVVPENAMGNWVWPLQVLFKPNEMEMHEFLSNMRRELRDFLNKKAGKFKGEEGFLVIAEWLRERAELHGNTKESISIYRATSFCKLPVYEIDFGWGKPTWVTNQINEKNLFVLSDTKCGDGIEAWVTLDGDEMAIFESDKQLLTFASVNPSAS